MALLREGTGRMKQIAAGIAFILLSIWYPTLSAADVEVTLRVDREEATLVDTIRMEVGVSGSRNSDAEPVLHGLEDFLVRRGGTSSRNHQRQGECRAYVHLLHPAPEDRSLRNRPCRDQRGRAKIGE